MRTGNLKLFVILGLLVFSFLIGATTFSVEGRSSTIGNDNYVPLLAKARENGSIKVIIRLDVKFEPEGKLAGSASIQSQRSGIQRTQNDIARRLNLNQSNKVRRFTYVPQMAMEIDEALLIKLINDPKVISVHEDRLMEPTLMDSVPLIGANTAWSWGYSGNGQVIAILDTGVDGTHPFLSGKLVSEACFSNYYGDGITLCPNGLSSQVGPGAAEPCFICDHGTHVSGIAAGSSVSFSGVAKDASLIGIQVFTGYADCTGYGDPCITAWTSDIISGLEHVYELKDSFNIASVNLSLGGGSYDAPCRYDSLEPAINNLYSVNIATIVASGNEDCRESIGSPACVPNAISVGSTDLNDVVSDFSNVASFLDFFAPGDWIYSSIPGGGYEYKPGTSMAAPHVAGAWAVLKSKMPNATIEEVYSAFTGSGVLVDDNRSGGSVNDIPRIQIDAALTLLGATPTPTSTSTSANTPTSTATSTCTPTSTNTATSTPTSTSTLTSTPTSTSTPTPTYTPTDTPTPTNTLEPTETPIPTETLSPITVCADVTEIPQRECQALVYLYNSTNGNNWFNNNNWLVTNTPCSWFGVHCESGSVDRLELGSNNLNGTIPSQIGNLELWTLDLQSNQLTGNVPGSMAGGEVRYLYLNNNLLDGELPSGFMNKFYAKEIRLDHNQLGGDLPGMEDLCHIENLYLNDNQFDGEIPGFSQCGGPIELYMQNNNLTGTIPLIGVGNPPMLEILDLSNNELGGTIPPEYFTEYNLHSLILNDNQLTGSVPNFSPGYGMQLEELILSNNQLSGGISFNPDYLRSLQTVKLGHNNFSGGISASFGYLDRLTVLYLNDNQFGGTIPASLGDSQLRELRLSNNELTGNIPSELGNVIEMVDLGLEGNFLSGTIPTSLGNLSNLEILLLGQNQLDGSIPVEFGNLSHLQQLGLEDNALGGLIPSTIVNLINLDPEGTDFGYNKLFSSNQAVLDFLNDKDPDWNETQTIPPENLQLVDVNGTSVELSWAPIQYTSDGGYYEVLYSQHSGGPYSLHGTTTDKTISSYVADGLDYDRSYYFVIRAFTPGHGSQQNDLTSDFSLELSAITGPFHCENVSEISQNECEALVALYNSTNGSNWSDRTGWLDTILPCSWYGVSCDGGKVTILSLEANNLNGGLPAQLGNLSFLIELSLPNNQISGSIPVEIGNLSNLSRLKLDRNEMDGIIPAEVGGLSSLEQISLYDNQFNGNIPAAIGNLFNLSELHLYTNQLYGDIPPELGDLVNLQELSLYDNQLTGTIPSEIGNLTNLLYLDLSRNCLEGPLPSEIGNLNKLLQLRIDNNAIEGEIPGSIVHLVDLGPATDFGYNMLYSHNPTTVAFLDARDPDWDETQTIPPSGVGTSSLGSTQLELSWTPIPYIGDGGHYDILYSDTPGGPYTIYGITTDKLTTTYVFEGLIPETKYYFVIRTYTPVHGIQQNEQLSSYSLEFSTTTNPFDCSEVSEIPQNECEALVALFRNTNGDHWLENTNWLMDLLPCGWSNVVCDQGHVMSLILWKNNLQGTIPSEIGGLGYLEYLDLGLNNIEGGVPPELGNLSNLLQLYVDSNPLEGALPQSLKSLSSLYKFWFNATSLCEPGDDEFQAWLNSLIFLERTGDVCSVCNLIYLPIIQKK